MERRTIRVTGELRGYRDMPGLARVAEVRTVATTLKTGERREQLRYLFTTLTAARASPARLLALSRGHWRIENTLFHVKDDSFGEDRHVLSRRRSAEALCGLRNAAMTLLRGRCVADGLEAALNRRASARNYERRPHGAQEARRVALCCRDPPDGAARRSLRRLPDKLVELEVVEAISHETVRSTLKNNELTPWQKRQWCLPPQANDEFVWRMEGGCAGGVHPVVRSAVSPGLPRRTEQAVAAGCARPAPARAGAARPGGCRIRARRVANLAGRY